MTLSRVNMDRAKIAFIRLGTFLLIFSSCVFLPHTAFAAIVIDGTATNNTISGTNSGSVTLTTANANDVIVVLVETEVDAGAPPATVSSVTASGLTFAQRSAVSGTGAGQFGTSWDDMEVWWATTTSALSGESILVTLSKSVDNAVVVAFGVSGANTSSPWDSAGPITSHNTSSTPQPGTITLSTNNVTTDDLLLGFVGAQTNEAQTAGDFGSTAASFIDGAQNGGGDYSAYAAAEDLVAPTQSSTAVSWGTSWAGLLSSSYLIADALQAASSGGSCATLSPGVNFITSTTTTCLIVPSNWNSSNNTIEVIGGGSGGAGGDLAGNAGSGGGGGAYTEAVNVALTPGATVGINIGPGGAGGASTNSSTGGAGGDTYVCNSINNCLSLAGSAVVAGAQGGQSSVGYTTGGAGGSASSGVGSITHSGGSGTAATTAPYGGTGGGGAAGPGSGGAAGGGISVNHGGSGGGGSSGGSSGVAGTDSTGGAGGSNAASNGAGSGGASGTNGTNGGPGGSSTGSGAGGGGGGGEGTAGTQGNGGNGGSGEEWNSSYGSGGGGGGGGGNSTGGDSVGGNGGLYGGGGGGAGGNTTGSNVGGTGGQGIIVITYTPATGRIIRLRGGLRLIGGVRLGGTSPIPRQTFATLSIDGTPNTNTATGASTITVPLTTSLTNDIIVVDVHNEVPTSNGAGVTVQSVTAPGLTFAERSSMSEAGTEYTEYDDLERWWALATSTFSGTITVTFNAAIDDASVVAYGVHGANTSSP